MIVISGALVLVALVLLVIGLIDPSLGFVYASIAVSLASFVFLVIGILQRRKEVLPGTEGAGHSGGPVLAGVGAVARAGDKLLHRGGADDKDGSAVSTLPPVYAAPAGDGATGQVLVVAGRPRYHVEGCRYLAGKDADSVDVAVARADSYTACGVCKPDASLTTAPAEPVLDGAATDDAEVEVVTPTRSTAKVSTVKAEPVRATRKAAAPTARIAAPAKKAAAKEATPRKAAAPAKAAAPVKKAVAPVKKAAAPAKAAAPVKKAAAPAKAVAPVKKAAAPVKKAAAPAKAAAPVKKAAAPVKAAAPAKRAVAPVKKAVAPVKKAAAPVKAPAKVAAPAKKAPAKAAAPVKKAAAKAPAKKAAAKR